MLQVPLVVPEIAPRGRGPKRMYRQSLPPTELRAHSHAAKRSGGFLATVRTYLLAVLDTVAMSAHEVCSAVSCVAVLHALSSGPCILLRTIAFFVHVHRFVISARM